MAGNRERKPREKISNEDLNGEGREESQESPQVGVGVGVRARVNGEGSDAEFFFIEGSDAKWRKGNGGVRVGSNFCLMMGQFCPFTQI